jgi:hypothetical protein
MLGRSAKNAKLNNIIIMNKKKIFLTLTFIALFVAGLLAHHYNLNELMAVFSVLGIIGGLCQLFIGGYGLLQMIGFFKRDTELPNHYRTMFPIVFVSGSYLLFISLASM